MLFLDDGVKSDLAKASTVLQCILAILDYEANKFHYQPEVIDVENNIALVNIDKMSYEQTLEVCRLVNLQFKRLDNAPTCAHVDIEDSIIFCEGLPLDQYSQLT